MEQAIDIPFLKEWVATLRSGKYQQGFGGLRETPDDGPDAFCCLGVAQDILAKKEPERFSWYRATNRRWIFHDLKKSHSSSGVLIYTVRSRIGRVQSSVYIPGVLDRSGKSFALTDLNDEGMPFEQIADVIEYFFIP